METRFNGKVVPFASGASSGERTIFGDWSTSSDDINANLNADFIAGWENGLEGTLNPYPPSQYFNAALYTVSSLVSYLYQQGIPEYNALQEYKINSMVVAPDGDIYRAKTGTSVSPNLGNNPLTDSINWESLTSIFVPTGKIDCFPYTTPPSGYLECNGATLSRTTYSKLFGKIGTTFGAGDGSTTFKLPDLRGEFIRGFDNGRGVDSGRTIGSWQVDVFKSHSHTYIRYESTTNRNSGTIPVLEGAITQYTGSTGGSETRPRNIAMMYCIKY